MDIPEYWIVDPLDMKVTLCNLQDGAYDDRVFTADRFTSDPESTGETGAIVSPTFPSLTLTAAQVLNARR